MSIEHSATDGKCSREQVREAAVWLTLLRRPDRTAKIDSGFKRWLAAKPAHAAAFETVSTAWEVAGELPRGPLPRLSRWQRAGFRQGFLYATAAAAGLAAFAIGGSVFLAHGPGVSTTVGEQRILALDDGTRVFLNTDTHMVVHYDKRRRAIELQRGEALFEVAKAKPDWPFVVTVDGKNVTALGTAFDVRRDPDRVAVTLVEGKVAVSGKDSMAILSPGQRLTFAHDLAPKLDQPSIEKMTAWRSGYVDLGEMPLADAVAEMNRYSRLKVAVAEPEAAAVHVAGVFRAGDAVSFTNAVATSYGLQVSATAQGITLLGKPRMK